MALKDLVSKGTRAVEAGFEATMAPSAAPEAPKAPVATPAARTSPPATVLDASIEFSGTIRCEESIRIDGRCEGELYSAHAVIVGEPAVLRMSIEADSVVIGGQVNGDITARRKITLEPTARVTGNLSTPGIVIQEGAKLKGRIVIGSDAAPATAAQAKPKAPEAETLSASASPQPRKPTPSAPPPVS